MRSFPMVILSLYSWWCSKSAFQMEKWMENSGERLSNDHVKVHRPLLRDCTRDRCSPSRDIFCRATAWPSPITFYAPSLMFRISEEAMQGRDIMSAYEIHKGPPDLLAVSGMPRRLFCIQTLAKNKYTVQHWELRHTLHLSAFQRFWMFRTYCWHRSWLSIAKCRGLSCVIFNDLNTLRKCFILAWEARLGSGWWGLLAGHGHGWSNLKLEGSIEVRVIPDLVRQDG